MKSFSASSLYDQQCPRRVWLSNLYPQMVDPPENIPEMTLSNVVHAVINRALKTREPLRLGRMLLDFDAKWAPASESLTRRETAKLSEIGRRCIHNFFARYGEGGEAASVLDSEVHFKAKVSTHGHVIRAMNEHEPWAYSLHGRLDILERPKPNAFRIRDLKLSYQHSDKPRYRLQFGTYQFCPSFFFGSNEVTCEIFDMSSGAIIPIEQYSQEKMHRIVTSTIKRAETDPQGRDRRFCFDCPVASLCEAKIPQRTSLQPCLSL